MCAAQRPLSSAAPSAAHTVAATVIMSNAQIWGLEVPSGAATAAPAGSSTLHVTGATLVPVNRAVSDSSLGMTQYLLSAQLADSREIVLASLSASRPSAQLDLVAALGKGKQPAFTLTTIPSTASATYTVHLSGYTAAEGAAAAAKAAPTAAAAAAAAATPKRKAEEAAATPKSSTKKAKVASEDDEDDDEPAAAKSAPSTPKSSRPAIVTLKNGLKLQDTKIGTGKEATDKSAVGIRYRGSLASNGKVFDSNMPRGQPLRFKIGAGDVIAGFEQGTKGMKVGGTRTVVIPAHLGYGARGAPPDIPGNATLVFDLELVSVK